MRLHLSCAHVLDAAQCEAHSKLELRYLTRVSHQWQRKDFHLSYCQTIGDEGVQFPLEAGFGRDANTRSRMRNPTIRHAEHATSQPQTQQQHGRRTGIEDGGGGCRSRVADSVLRCAMQYRLRTPVAVAQIDPTAGTVEDRRGPRIVGPACSRASAAASQSSSSFHRETRCSMGWLCETCGGAGGCHC